MEWKHHVLPFVFAWQDPNKCHLATPVIEQMSFTQLQVNVGCVLNPNIQTDAMVCLGHVDHTLRQSILAPQSFQSRGTAHRHKSVGCLARLWLLSQLHLARELTLRHMSRIVCWQTSKSLAQQPVGG